MMMFQTRSRGYPACGGASVDQKRTERMSNTAKTVWGYLKAAVNRYTPLKLEGDRLDDIFNFHRFDDRLCTSGQPTEAQFYLIKDAGYEIVINLAPTNLIENSLRNEDELLNDLGFKYIHIPVNFADPTEDDFNRFVAAMGAAAEEKLWVHCAANMRVSAFMYRYRRDTLGVDESVARRAMAQIWAPFGVWKSFTAIRNDARSDAEH
jgi:protein tyrosine phosphatase (PTP) superfamily phosphohydrolase (DUF442 family)